MAEFGELVRVVWLDAHGSAANVAYDLDEIPHCPIEVVSYGILLKSDDIGVSIASESCDKSTYRGYSFIPKGMLLKIEPVKRKRVRKVKADQVLDTPPILEVKSLTV